MVVPRVASHTHALIFLEKSYAYIDDSLKFVLISKYKLIVKFSNTWVKELGELVTVFLVLPKQSAQIIK